MADETELVAMSAAIISAYLAKNLVPPSDLPGLIREVYGTLRSLSRSSAAVAESVPAVPVKRSVAAGYVVCLVCGIKLKSLKRHLGSRHAMGPEEYKARFGLTHSHPLVAPSYAAARSKLAIGMGLGRKRKGRG